MLDLLSGFITTVSSLVDFVINIITSFTNLLVNLPTYISFLTVSITSLIPSVVLPFCVASISVYVVFLILGRN